MAVKTEQVEKNLVKLTFEVSREKFEEGMNDSYKKNKSKFNIPGFRKGKVPKAMVEKYYTESVFYDDAINYVLPDAYDAAVKEAELDVVAKPEIDIDEIKKGEPVVFTALVTTKPEVKLGDYTGIEVEKIDNTVSDEDVDKDIEATRKRNARIISVEDRAVENGDITVIDFEGFCDGEAFDGGKAEGYELEIGSGSFIPGFEEQIIGAKIDDDIEVNVTFPEDYHVEELKGKPAMFKVKVHEIKVRELPELDDDFASEVSEFETLEEYKDSIRKKLEEKAESKTKQETENAVIEKVCENAEVDIPEAMIQAQIDRIINDFAQRLQYQGMNLDMYLQYTGGTMEAMRESFKEQAEKQCRVSLVIEAVTDKEGITANNEELDEKIAEMAKIYNMEVEKLKEVLRPEDIDNIKRDISFGKTIDMMVNKAVIK
ncbi:MAG: trigger factor [Clostridia bacterium]|nr:trigger factor [Clostridia bacterium]